MKGIKEFFTKINLASLKDTPFGEAYWETGSIPLSLDRLKTLTAGEAYWNTQQLFLSKAFKTFSKDIQERIIDDLAEYFTEQNRNDLNYIKSQNIAISNLYHDYDPKSDKNLASATKIQPVPAEALELLKIKLAEKWQTKCPEKQKEFSEKICFTKEAWDSYAKKEAQYNNNIASFLQGIETEVKAAFEKQYITYLTDIVTHYNETAKPTPPLPHLKQASDLNEYVTLLRKSGLEVKELQDISKEYFGPALTLVKATTQTALEITEKRYPGKEAQLLENIQKVQAQYIDEETAKQVYIDKSKNEGKKELEPTKIDPHFSHKDTIADTAIDDFENALKQLNKRQLPKNVIPKKMQEVHPHITKVFSKGRAPTVEYIEAFITETETVTQKTIDSKPLTSTEQEKPSKSWKDRLNDKLQLSKKSDGVSLP